MAFKGITFAGQNVTPKNDGGLYNAHYGDGILWGCSMNISGDDLVIQSGEFIMGGRVVQVDGATSVDLSGRTLQTGYIQVIMNADLSQGEGNQWYPTFVESTTTTFPALTQGNINDTDTLYQLELAVVQISGGILSLYSSVGYSSVLLTSTTTDGGIIADPTNSSLVEYVENGIIYLRPNGANSSSGQFYVRPNGEATVNGEGHFNEESGSSQSAIRLYSVGSEKATWIYSPTGQFSRVINSSGLGGIKFFDTGETHIFANGQNLAIRPNGESSSIGQVYWDTDGNQHGGHKLVYGSGSATPFTANGVTTLRSVSSLDSTGTYLAIGHVTFTPSASTTVTHYLQLGTGSGGTGLYAINEKRIGTQSAVRMEVCGLKNGTTSIYLSLNAGVSSSVTSVELAVIRLS